MHVNRPKGVANEQQMHENTSKMGVLGSTGPNRPLFKPRQIPRIG